MNEDDTFNALRKAPTEDQIGFGRNVWIYCNQHLSVHRTGWCTVSNRNKILLEAKTDKEAIKECRAKGLKLYYED